MSFDSTLNVVWAMIVPSLMALIGIWISVATLKSKRQKVISISAFVILMFVGVIAAAWAAQRSDKAQRQRDASIASLGGQLNVMGQYVLHPPLPAGDLIASRQAPKAPAPRNRSTAPPSRGATIRSQPAVSGESQDQTTQQLKARVSEFTSRLRDFENAFLSKQREIDLSQPLLLDETPADRDSRLQQQTIDRLQRLSDYETTYRKEYLPDALRLQAELIQRTPPTQFPEIPPFALTFGSPTGGLSSSPFLLGASPLGDVADYLERLANRLP